MPELIDPLFSSSLRPPVGEIIRVVDPDHFAP